MVNIFVVDDEELFLRTVSRYFSRRGFVVDAADNAWTAINKVTDSYDRVDVVLLDYDLPDMKGPECLQKLREVRSDIRCIMLSGYPPETFTEDEIKDADVVLYKPVELTQLEQTILQLCQ